MNEEFQSAVSAALVKQNEQISNLQNAISSRDDMLSELLLKVGALQVEQHTPATASSSRKTPKKDQKRLKVQPLTKAYKHQKNLQKACRNQKDSFQSAQPKG
ncbi:hypothetical protein O181_047079 [Austropuccinia psidii MF-1]|uniref:Uncharacterized protein n=1 Tax=Austropuccinia psidii MF-1 TaxID=1389203 RepID=A0A9Q3DQ56_9BASI|nr:hypothetical protein [Austropuccinia psidii MF-1]